MKLIIDKEDVNFELENEENLLEIIKSINTYLNKHNRHISKVQINKEKEIDFDNESLLKGCALDDIEILEIYSDTPVNNALDSLVELKTYAEKYIDVINNKIDNISPTKVEEIEGLKWIINGTSGAVLTLGMDSDIIYYNKGSLKEFLDKLFLTVKDLEEYKNDEEEFKNILKNVLLNKLEDFRAFLNIIGLRIYYYFMSDSERSKLKNKLSELIQEDTKAMREIKTISGDYLEKVKLYNDKKKWMRSAKRITGFIGAIVKDILFVNKVMETKIEGLKIDGIKDTYKYTNELMGNILKINSMIFRDEKDKFLKEFDNKIKTSFENLVLVLKYIEDSLK